MCVCTLLLSELAASLWKVQDRKGWHGSTGVEKRPSSFATSASGRFPLTGKPQAIDFPYGDATKQLNHLLSRDGKRTLGSSVPGQVILRNLTWTFLTEKQSLHHKPWYHVSRITFLQCSATQPSCSVQLHTVLRGAQREARRQHPVFRHEQHPQTTTAAVTGSVVESTSAHPHAGSVAAPGDVGWAGSVEVQECWNASADKSSSAHQDATQAGRTCGNPRRIPTYFYDGMPRLTVLSWLKAQQDPNPHTWILEITCLLGDRSLQEMFPVL